MIGLFPPSSKETGCKEIIYDFVFQKNRDGKLKRAKKRKHKERRCHTQNFTVLNPTGIKKALQESSHMKI